MIKKPNKKIRTKSIKKKRDEIKCWGAKLKKKPIKI